MATRPDFVISSKINQSVLLFLVTALTFADALTFPPLAVSLLLLLKIAADFNISSELAFYDFS